ncbi:MAG: hypothetical protein ACRD1H_14885, partial [Vicinamibacterales bacterium]
FHEFENGRNFLREPVKLAARANVVVTVNRQCERLKSVAGRAGRARVAAAFEDFGNSANCLTRQNLALDRTMHNAGLMYRYISCFSQHAPTNNRERP